MMGASRPLGPAALAAESWEILFQQTVSFADYQVNRLCWRGLFGGVLPGGFDPNSIAAQAIMDFLQQSPDLSQFRPPPDSPTRGERSSISPGERAGASASLNATDLPPPPQDSCLLEQILWEVKRLVLRQVSRLHHLKENWLLASEADLTLVRNQDGDLVSPLELIAAPDIQPDEPLIRKESFIEYAKLKLGFEVFLAKERRLITLFELRCDGISKPQDLAARLKLGVRTVGNLQKRLQRRWLAFSKYPQTAHRNIIIRQE